MPYSSYVQVCWIVKFIWQLRDIELQLGLEIDRFPLIHGTIYHTFDFLLDCYLLVCYECCALWALLLQLVDFYDVLEASVDLVLTFSELFLLPGYFFWVVLRLFFGACTEPFVLRVLNLQLAHVFNQESLLSCQPCEHWKYEDSLTPSKLYQIKLSRDWVLCSIEHQLLPLSSPAFFNAAET